MQAGQPAVASRAFQRLLSQLQPCPQSPFRTLRVAEQQAATFRAQGVTATSAALDDKPADALINEAERLEAELIIVGNRRMQGVSRLLGSVANEVAHNAPCDVLVVKTV